MAHKPMVRAAASQQEVVVLDADHLGKRLASSGRSVARSPVGAGRRRGRRVGRPRASKRRSHASRCSSPTASTATLGNAIREAAKLRLAAGHALAGAARRAEAAARRERAARRGRRRCSHARNVDIELARTRAALARPALRDADAAARSAARGARAQRARARDDRARRRHDHRADARQARPARSARRPRACCGHSRRSARSTSRPRFATSRRRSAARSPRSARTCAPAPSGSSGATYFDVLEISPLAEYRRDRDRVSARRRALLAAGARALRSRRARRARQAERGSSSRRRARRSSITPQRGRYMDWLRANLAELDDRVGDRPSAAKDRRRRVRARPAARSARATRIAR